MFPRLKQEIMIIELNEPKALRELELAKPYAKNNKFPIALLPIIGQHLHGNVVKVGEQIVYLSNSAGLAIFGHESDLVNLQKK